MEDESSRLKKSYQRYLNGLDRANRRALAAEDLNGDAPDKPDKEPCLDERLEAGFGILQGRIVIKEYF